MYAYAFVSRMYVCCKDVFTKTCSVLRLWTGKPASFSSSIIVKHWLLTLLPHQFFHTVDFWKLLLDQNVSFPNFSIAMVTSFTIATISWYHAKVKFVILWRFSSALIWDLVRDNFRNSKLRFGKDGIFPWCIIFSLNLKPILKQVLSLAWNREKDF